MTTSQIYLNKAQQWYDHGFERVTLATINCGLVERLDELLKQKGVEFLGYLNFDALETHLGFPMPVRSRYVVPLFPYVDLSQDTIYPGIAIAEILGFHRGIDIQILLDRASLRKIAVRGQAVITKEGDDRQIVKPGWWPYEYFVEDMTRPYDLKMEVKSQPFDKETALEVYLWGNTNNDVTEISYESENPEDGIINDDWKDAKLEVDHAFEQMGKCIDHVLCN